MMIIEIISLDQAAIKSLKPSSCVQTTEEQGPDMDDVNCESLMKSLFRKR